MHAKHSDEFGLSGRCWNTLPLQRQNDFEERGIMGDDMAARASSLLATSVVIVGRESFLRTTVIHTTNGLI